MQKLILFSLVTIAFFACKKLATQKPVEGPSGNFALDDMEVEANRFGTNLYDTHNYTLEWMRAEARFR